MGHILLSIAATFSGTSLTLDTPTWTAPSTAIAMTGRYTGGAPSALDYSFDGGSTWVAATTPTIGSGNFAFSVAAGLSAGTYVPKVRDHNATYSTATCGTLHINSWLPSSLTNLVACFDTNDLTKTPDNGSGQVTNMYHLYNNAKFIQQSDANHRPNIARGSGFDGRHRVLQCQTVPAINTNSPTADYMFAGGQSGFAALVNLANTSNLSSGSYTMLMAAKLDFSVPYHNMCLWGQGTTPGPNQYIQMRMNGSNPLGYNYSPSGGVGGSVGYTTTSGGWHTMGFVKNNATVTIYFDGASVATGTLTNTTSFSANATDGDFLLGGGLLSGIPVGQACPGYGGMIFTSDALSGSSLTNALAWCAASCGIS